MYINMKNTILYQNHRLFLVTILIPKKSRQGNPIIRLTIKIQCRKIHKNVFAPSKVQTTFLCGLFVYI